MCQPDLVLIVKFARKAINRFVIVLQQADNIRKHQRRACTRQTQITGMARLCLLHRPVAQSAGTDVPLPAALVSQRGGWLPCQSCSHLCYIQEGSYLSLLYTSVQLCDMHMGVVLTYMLPLIWSYLLFNLYLNFTRPCAAEIL